MPLPDYALIAGFGNRAPAQIGGKSQAYGTNVIMPSLKSVLSNCRPIFRLIQGRRRDHCLRFPSLHFTDRTAAYLAIS